jgi:hypothetical protein
MSDEQEQDSSPLVPIEQQTIVFYGKPLVVVRLPDGRPGIVLRHLCDNLQLEPTSQLRRIKRTEAIVPMIWCIPRSKPTADHKSCRRWCCEPLHFGLLALILPVPPADDASLDTWRNYHRQMVAWIDWQHAIESWRGSVESRLEGLEEVTNLIPEILERLGPQTLTSEHQRAVQKYVQQMHELTGKPYGTIYDSLKTAFGAPKYAAIPDQDWQRVVQWFRAQLEQWRKK